MEVINSNFCFIITRNVINEKTNIYWNICCESIRKYYDNDIYIICDNSDDKYIKMINEIQNIQVIKSDYPSRGEILPYYYFNKFKFNKYAIIIHDSSFIQKKIELVDFKKIKFIHYFSHTEQSKNILNDILKEIEHQYSIKMFMEKKNRWRNCFGVQSIITLDFCQHIFKKYQLENLLNYIYDRKRRIEFEKLFGLICSYEYYLKNENIENITLFGKEIYKYQPKAFHYKIHNYIQDKNKYNLDIIKIWTGR